MSYFEFYTSIYIFSYLYVSCSGSITSVGEERERFPLPLGAWDGLRYFIAALPEPSIKLF